MTKLKYINIYYICILGFPGLKGTPGVPGQPGDRGLMGITGIKVSGHELVGLVNYHINRVYICR